MALPVRFSFATDIDKVLSLGRLGAWEYLLIPTLSKYGTKSKNSCRNFQKISKILLSGNSISYDFNLQMVDIIHSVIQDEMNK